MEVCSIEAIGLPPLLGDELVVLEVVSPAASPWQRQQRKPPAGSPL